MGDENFYIPTEKDKAFMEKCKRYDAIESYERKVRLYFQETGTFPEHSGNRTGLLIDGKVYQINVAPQSGKELETYSLLYFELLSAKIIEQKIQDFEHRYQHCNNDTEGEKLIEKEIDVIEQALKSGKKKDCGIIRGYENSVSKYAPGFKLNQIGIITPKEVKEYIEGMALYALEIYLKELDRKKSTRVSDNSSINDVGLVSLPESQISNFQQTSNDKPEENGDTEEARWNRQIEVTIEKYLEPFKEKLIYESDYKLIVKLLKAYFEGRHESIRKPFLIKSRNRKKLGEALGNIYEGLKEETVPKEYFELWVKIFNCFKNDDLTSNRLYKYFHSKN